MLSIKIWRRHGFDVIHACNPPDLIFLIGLFYKFFAGKSFVFDHHDANPEFYEAKFGRRDLLWRLLRIAEKLTFKAADISIATNESYRRIAIERGGMRPERVFVVRSGPNLDRVKNAHPRSALARRSSNSSSVMWASSADPRGSIYCCLRSSTSLAPSVGRIFSSWWRAAAPNWKSVKQACENMDLADYITFAGRIDDAELCTMLSTADVCVNPDRVSAMNDISTMNKVMEYMALGKPIVQFDVKEGRVSAQDASLYARPNDPVDFAEKILALIDHPQRRIRMGEYGRKRVEQTLAWHHEQPKLLNAYAMLVELRRRGSGFLSSSP